MKTRNQCKLYALKTIALHSARYPERTESRIVSSTGNQNNITNIHTITQKEHYTLTVAEVQLRYPFIKGEDALLITQNAANIAHTLYPNAVIQSTLVNHQDDPQDWTWEIKLTGLHLLDPRNYHPSARPSIKADIDAKLQQNLLIKKYKDQRLSPRNILAPKHPASPLRTDEIELLTSPLLQHQV